MLEELMEGIGNESMILYIWIRMMDWGGGCWMEI